MNSTEARTPDDRCTGADPTAGTPPRARRRASRGATAVLLATAIGPAVCPTAGAAVPVEGTTITGRATYYGSGPNPGMNCSFPAGIPANNLYAAAGPSEWAGSGGCGGVMRVTGSRGTADIMITDQCPECEPGHLDLSQEAYAAIGPFPDGITPISYHAVKNPTLPSPLAVKIKEGSSQWWTAFLIMHHGNPLVKVEVLLDGTYVSLPRTAYNYWLKQDGAGPGPYTLRLTDIYGQVATVPDVALLADQVQQTDVWMYGTGTR